jgi:hypothetical protein
MGGRGGRRGWLAEVFCLDVGLGANDRNDQGRGRMLLSTGSVDLNRSAIGVGQDWIASGVWSAELA